MAKALLYNSLGEKKGDLDVSSKIFEVKMVPDVVHQIMVSELSNTRNTVSHTKTRGEVSGSGKKPWKQKGTGNARAGSIRSPIWRHGGITFGPRSNRNYQKKINRSMFRKGIAMILTDKLSSGSLIFLDQIPSDVTKTKSAVSFLKKLRSSANITSKKISFIVPKDATFIQRSLRNVQGVQVLPLSQISTYHLLNGGTIVILNTALVNLEKHLTS